MLKTKPILLYTALAVVLFAAIPASIMLCQYHSSKYPPPSGFKSGGEEKKEAKADDKKSSAGKQGTTQNPIVLQILPGSNHDKAAEKYANEEEDHSSGEWWLAYLTVALVAFTGGLMVFTALLWSATIKLMEATEGSTKTIERAYVKMSPVEGTIKETDPGKYGARIEVKNFGNTPANISDVVVIVAVTMGKLPAVFPDQNPRELGLRPVSAFLVSSEFFYYNAQDLQISADEMTNAIAKKIALFMIGYVDYRDQFGVRHRGGFARQWIPSQDGKKNDLIFVVQPGYNYDRERKQGEGNDWGEDSPV